MQVLSESITDLHIDLETCKANVRHHLHSNGCHTWKVNVVVKNNNTEAPIETHSLLTSSDEELSGNFIDWLGNIAKMSDQREQACFDILHNIQSLFPQTIIDQIIQDIDQKKKQELLG